MSWCIVLFVGIGDHWSALFLLFIGGNDKLQLQTLLLPPIQGRTLKNPTQTLWVLVSHHAWPLHGYAIQVFDEIKYNKMPLLSNGWI
jgi:hypothetical protein